MQSFITALSFLPLDLVGFILSFAAIIVLGSIMLSKVSIPRVLGGAIGASILFFIISNFGVWLSDPDYPLTWGGLVLCYEMAIPFSQHLS